VTFTFKDRYEDFKRKLVANSLTELILKVALSVLFPKKLGMKGNAILPNFMEVAIPLRKHRN
jgi:hypothetical protein